MNEEVTFWGIHPGRDGAAEDLFERESVIALGWDRIGDLSLLKTREDFKREYRQAYPEGKEGTVPVHAGILYRFVQEVQKGDIVICPIKSAPSVWIGRITGDYHFNLDYHNHFHHIRKVEWLKRIPRTKFSQGALYEIGSAMTLFQVRNYADEFATALEGKEPPEIPTEEEEEAVELVADEIERQTHDFVLKQIDEKLKGHALAEFVGHLLELMGYETRVSPPGQDRGIDIKAYKDDLGVSSPTILVQVKSSEKEANERLVSELYGKVSRGGFALFVSIGGFAKHAKDFAFEKNNLRLVDGEELVKLVYKYYDRLDGKYKAIFPLREVYIPEAISEPTS